MASNNREQKKPSTPDAETPPPLDNSVIRRQRLSLELAKLDPEQERALAEERLGEAPWPMF